MGTVGISPALNATVPGRRLQSVNGIMCHQVKTMLLPIILVVIRF